MEDKDMSELVHPGLQEAAAFKNPFSRAKEAVRNAVVHAKNDVLYGKSPVTSSEPLMPYSVQYALSYKEGKLGHQEISALVVNNLTDLATYSILKALNSEQEEQQSFLESFVDTVYENPDNPSALQPLQQLTVQNALGKESDPIAGAKIAQIIRQGAHLWQEKFQEVAEDLKENRNTPVYIAYAGTLGLRQAVAGLKDTERSMMVLIPDWIKENNEYSGYEIDLGREKGERVSLLPKDFERPENFIFVDDTRRNGMHAQVMWDYWTKNSGKPLSEDHIKVVNFAPKTALV
jgi:hypothetical protein